MKDGLATALSERDQAHAAFARTEAELQAARGSIAAVQAEAQAQVTAAQQERDALMASLVPERQARLMAESRALSNEDYETFARWRYLKGTDRLIAIDDFGVKPATRFGYGKPEHAGLQALFAAQEDKYRAVLESFLPFLPQIATIPSHPTDDPAEPNWINLAFPAFDAISLYGLLATHEPARFIEIGSGFSTKFARRSIRDNKLKTKIISIDPEPRAEIDAICDEVVRSKLEDTSLDFFKGVTKDDFIFFDGSHRTFQNSDVTVFFTEILPMLPSGVLVGIHDIFWPIDYPPAWLSWYFSEQYMLACWLLAGDRLDVQLPVHFAERQPELMQVLAPYWSHPALAGASHGGGAFFFRVR